MSTKSNMEILLDKMAAENRQLKNKLAIIEPLQKRWGEALADIHNRFDELNGRECESRECGSCIRCLAAKALLLFPPDLKNEPNHIP